MKVGVVGNREGWSLAFVNRKLKQNNLNENDIIITGGAKGVDTHAIWYAYKHGIDVIIKHPRRSLPVPKRYFERNNRIINESEMLIAFDLKDLEHSGTRNSINLAERKGIPIKLYSEHKV